MRGPVRAALAAAVGLVALWLAWWPLVAWQQVRATEAWLAERRADGWQAEVAGIAIGGFPHAHVRRLDAPALADPAAGWAWEAPTLTLVQPRHAALRDAPLALVWPDRQVLRSPETRTEVAARGARAQVWRDRAGALRRARVVAQDIDVRRHDGDGPRRWQAESLEASAEAPSDDPTLLRLTAGLRGTRLADARGDALPGPERLDLDAEIAFDAPWDMAALTDARPQPRRIALREAALDWGGLTLRIAGEVTLDAGGVPEGRLVVQAANWRARLEAARAAGQLPPGLVEAIAAAGEVASRLSGRGDRLEAPLVFSGGRMRLGLLPLGPAPRLVLP